MGESDHQEQDEDHYPGWRWSDKLKKRLIMAGLPLLDGFFLSFLATNMWQDALLYRFYCKIPFKLSIILWHIDSNGCLYSGRKPFDRRTVSIIHPAKPKVIHRFFPITGGQDNPVVSYFPAGGICRLLSSVRHHCAFS